MVMSGEIKGQSGNLPPKPVIEDVQFTNSSSRDAVSTAVNPQPLLSDRELEVIELVAAGLTNQDIAEKLGISKRTVDNHISNILTKTATDNRVALVRWALQWGKVCLDEVNCCSLASRGQKQSLS